MQPKARALQLVDRGFWKEEMELEMETCVPRKHRREDGEEGREGPDDAAKRMKVDGSIPGARTTLPRSVSIPLLPVLCPAPTMLPMAPSTPPYHPLSIVPWAPRPAYLAPTTTSRALGLPGVVVVVVVVLTVTLALALTLTMTLRRCTWNKRNTSVHGPQRVERRGKVLGRVADKS